ncbi:hypothetical protein H9Y04_07510 [Streptomyces sp. TRM66268-LWL]|uniref:Monooxygenase n=1 Tax=Streptomyces polyasparticus TaxID=2767826 RepID=A0ABR7SAA3_9ACTN|nr:DUF5990 family protein [Streptomyces polyasparticus]MBC9712417.1 hypothetical protein [Streptomyces polyasparticus]
MTAPAKGTLRLHITGHTLPGRTCGEFHNVHVAVQRGREPERPVAGDAAGAEWEFDIGTVPLPDGALDFRGPYVHGPRGARFLYLTWGELPEGGTFTMFRRAKLFLADIPASVVATGAARLDLGLTDSHGMPLCAAVRPPVAHWRKNL